MPYYYKSVAEFEKFVASKSYVSGNQASKDDLAVFSVMTVPDPASFPNASRWYNHISALVGNKFPGEPAGVIIAGEKKENKAKGGDGEKKMSKAEKKAANKKSDEERKAEIEAKKAEGEKIKAEKLVKACIKEGGKKGVEIEGAHAMGQVGDFFCTTIEKPDGNLELLKRSMEGMNEEAEEGSEERKGCSGHIGKMIFSAGAKDLAIVVYVPEDKTSKVNALTWLNEVVNKMGVTDASIEQGGTPGLACGTIPGNEKEQKYPIKMKDEAFKMSFQYLVEVGAIQDLGDDDDSDDFVCGDDDFDDM